MNATTRRRFLGSTAALTTALAGGCVGGDDAGDETEGAETEANSPPPVGESQFDAFVETDGTEFVVDGEPVYLSGTNNFWITDPFTDRAFVDRRLRQFAERGFNVVRTWAFCEGQYAPDEEGKCLQPEPGVADQRAFEFLDYVIAKAGEYGLRLVLPLTDYWDHYGGMPKYAEWAGLEGVDEFYTDETAQQMYRTYVEYVLTRENSYTGLEYREDPTIMLWELANEPRLPSDGGDVETLGTWFEETASFVKGLDDNHLVSTGMEGFYDRGGDHWVEDGSQGTAYVDHHRIDTIDVCSFHAYPDSWGLDRERAVEWAREHVVDAHEAVGKPVFAGEFNWQADREGDWEQQLRRRNEGLRAWYDVFDEHDVNAAAVWQVVGADQQDHDGFNVKLSDESTMAIIDEYTRSVREKSAVEW